MPDAAAPRPETLSPARPQAWRLAWILGLVALPFLVLGLRWASFLPSVIDWDESLYLLQAREWLRGNWPLSGVWDMHPVGAPAVFAVALAAFGESLFAVRLLGALCVAATGYALVALVTALGGPRGLGYGAALLYAGHSILLGGLSSNTELLFAPLVTGALALALREGREWPRLLAMGAMIGTALLIKPVAAPEGCLAFALLAWPVLRAGRWARLVALAGAYLVLCLLPTALSGLAFALRGEFEVWFDSTLLAPFQYASGGASADTALFRITMAALALRWLLALALAALLLHAGAEPGARRLVRFGLLWLAVAALAVAIPGHYFPHYFLVLLPPLALLGAAGAQQLARLVRALRPRLLAALLVAAVAVEPVAFDLGQRLRGGFGMGLPDAPRRIAALINSELRPGEAIFVPNYQPVVYFLTAARLPTRFPFPVHLTGGFGQLAGVDTDAEVARILAERPRFIVLDRGEWFSMRASAMAQIAAALDEHYELVATFFEERSQSTVEVHRLLEPG